MRSKEEIIIEFNLSEEDFQIKYQSYEFALRMLNGDRDWNTEIRDIEEKFCSENEIKKGMVNFEQAVLNRIICNYNMTKF